MGGLFLLYGIRTEICYAVYPFFQGASSLKKVGAVLGGVMRARENVQAIFFERR
jgi:hypothetical protein